MAALCVATISLLVCAEQALAAGPSWDTAQCVQAQITGDYLFNSVAVSYDAASDKDLILLSARAWGSGDSLDIFRGQATPNSSQFGPISPISSLNSPVFGEYGAWVDQDAGKVFFTRQYDASTSGQLFSCNWSQFTLEGSDCAAVNATMIHQQHISLTSSWIYVDQYGARASRFDRTTWAKTDIYQLNYSNDGLGMFGLYVEPTLTFAITSSLCDSDYNTCPNSPNSGKALFLFNSNDANKGVLWKTSDSPINTQMLQDNIGCTTQEDPIVDYRGRLLYVCDSRYVIICQPSQADHYCLGINDSVADCCANPCVGIGCSTFTGCPQTDGDADLESETEVCIPDCSGKSCGDSDGCTGTCFGTCQQEDYTCNSSNVCESWSCNNDGTCNGAETFNSCPQDCDQTTRVAVESGSCNVQYFSTNNEPVTIESTTNCVFHINGVATFTLTGDLVLQCLGTRCDRVSGFGTVLTDKGIISINGVPTGTVGTITLAEFREDGSVKITVPYGMAWWVFESGPVVISSNGCTSCSQNCRDWNGFPSTSPCPQVVEVQATVNLTTEECVPTDPCTSGVCGDHSNGCSQNVSCGICPDGDEDDSDVESDTDSDTTDGDVDSEVDAESQADGDETEADTSDTDSDSSEMTDGDLDSEVENDQDPDNADTDTSDQLDGDTDQIDNADTETIEPPHKKGGGCNSTDNDAWGWGTWIFAAILALLFIRSLRPRLDQGPWIEVSNSQAPQKPETDKQ